MNDDEKLTDEQMDALLSIERRDHFTAAALMGLLAGRGTWPNDPKQFAEWAVQLGDATLTELAKIELSKVMP